MKIYGYVRCSALDQNDARQLAAMRELQIAPENIFTDKQSGKDFDRPNYKTLIEKLQPGDLVYFHSLDRMGRNYFDNVEQWRIITREKGADVVILDMPLLDTRVHKDLLGTLISDLVLNLLSYTAQNEREMIRKRQSEGIVAAKEKGVRFGRPVKQPPRDFTNVVRKWRKKDLSIHETLKICKMGKTAFYQRLREYGLL